MFDSHCHLNDEVFAGKLSQIYESSKKSGVRYVVVPAVDLPSSIESVRISELFNGLYPCVGIHPTGDLSGSVDEIIDKLQDLIIANSIVAVGETGLDYYRFDYSPEIQKKYFIAHINLAKKHGLPVIIHTRHSEDDMLEILSRNHYDGNFILHCCPSDKRLLEFTKKTNSYIGVCGDVTYDSTKAEFIRDVPLDHLLVETDAPYLTPLPIKNTNKFPNTPSNLIYIIRKVATIKGISEEVVMEQTSANARKVFGI